MNKKIIIVGGFQEIIELCEDIGYKIIGIIDNNLYDHFYNYPILGKDQKAGEIFKNYSNVPLVLTPDSPSTREKLFKHYFQIGFKFETIISPNARISRSAVIGLGTIVQDGVNVSANTNIGNCVKLNTGCNVMHDCEIGDFVTIAPNAVILGRIEIGESSYIGANSTILPNRIITNNVIVGAGAVVARNIETPYRTFAGVPARLLAK